MEPHRPPAVSPGNPFRRTDGSKQPKISIFTGSSPQLGLNSRSTLDLRSMAKNQTMPNLHRQLSPGNPFRQALPSHSTNPVSSTKQSDKANVAPSIGRTVSKVLTSSQNIVGFDMSGRPNGIYTANQLDQLSIANNQSSLRQINTTPISKGEKPIIVAIMGLTGAGKSTFIRNVTGRQDVVVGHSYRSETSKIQAYSVTVNNTELVLLDTPGFNDTYLSDEEVFKHIADYLARSFKKGQRLSGIIYLHRIDIPRVAGSALKSMRMLELLCGDESCPNITLAMTGWEVLEVSIRQRREKELCENDSFWKRMIEKGAKILSLPRDCDAQKRLFMTMKFEAQTVLQIQTRLNGDAGETVDDILAASGLNKHFARLKIEHEENTGKLQQRFESQMTSREAASQVSNKKLQESRRQIEETEQKLKESEERLTKLLKAQAERHEKALEAEKIKSRAMKKKIKAMEESQKELLAKAETLASQNHSSSSSSKPYEIVFERSLTPLPARELKERISRVEETAEEVTEEEVMLLSAMECKVLQAKLDISSPELRVYCDNCFKSPGVNDYLRCDECLGGSFLCCAECYNREGWCFDYDHEMRIYRVPPKAWMKSCRRARNPPGLEGLKCDSCTKLFKGVYLHCCQCADDFDLCVKCAVDGKTCNNSSHILHYGVTAMLPP